MYGSKIKSFAEVDSYSAKKQFEENIKRHIDGETKQYILGVDEDEYLNYLIANYSVEPLKIYDESEKINQPIIRKEKFSDYPRYYEYEREIYYFKVSYSFSGSAVLFKIRPSTWSMTSNEIEVSDSNKQVSFSVRILEKNPEKFLNAKKEAYDSAFTNLKNVNQFAEEWNQSVSSIASGYFRQIKNKFKTENDFFAAINISTNNQTESIFTVPQIKKIIVPQPKIDKNQEFSSVPTMSKKMYADIIKVIYDAGKSMEKKPALYINRDEEGLRDQFLFILETRYESVTATGETFNKRGKTDIILKYAEDNTNLFIAECKFWKGELEFHKAINQLFDRYLTWRDSKVALIFFVTNKNFSSVIETIRRESSKHEYFIRSNGNRGESSFSFIFRLANDELKEVFLEIILFHFDET